jgi:hypothetical protein
MHQHKVDHPQYHPTVSKTLARPARKVLTDEERAKHTWRNGVKVRK